MTAPAPRRAALIGSGFGGLAAAIRLQDATRDQDSFRLDVTSPSVCAGLMYGRIRNIEWIEPIRNG